MKSRPVAINGKSKYVGDNTLGISSSIYLPRVSI